MKMGNQSWVTNPFSWCNIFTHSLHDISAKTCIWVIRVVIFLNSVNKPVFGKPVKKIEFLDVRGCCKEDSLTI